MLISCKLFFVKMIENKIVPALKRLNKEFVSLLE